MAYALRQPIKKGLLLPDQATNVKKELETRKFRKLDEITKNKSPDELMKISDFLKNNAETMADKLFLTGETREKFIKFAQKKSGMINDQAKSNLMADGDFWT